jgi:hypothetical protein
MKSGLMEDLAAGGKEGAAGRQMNEEEKAVEEEGKRYVSKEVVREKKEDPP